MIGSHLKVDTLNSKQQGCFISLFQLIFVVWGDLSSKFPDFMYKTTALNTLKKTPSKEALQRYKMSGCVMLLIGIVMIIITLLGGLKGV